MQWPELRSHIRHLSARDITKIGQAFELGKKMHEGQKRKSGEPYFNHPVAVAHMLLDLNADTDTIIAALLHDTVEDTELTLEEIDREFNGQVAALIDGVTKLSSKDVAMSPKLDEQIETLRKIFSLMQQDVRIMVIKLVDRLHNMQTIEFLPQERQLLLARETFEVFVKIADKLCMQDLRDELESLCLATLERDTHTNLLELRSINEQRCNAIIEEMRTTMRSHDRIMTSKTNLLFEQKPWDQLRAQMEAGGTIATGMSFVTVAIVCDDIDGCYRMLGMLHQLWKREILSFQDFINAPQLNGYRGLHTTIIFQDGTRVRCKIRTKEMHEYARRGVTNVCFDGKTEISDILPWTERLSSLTTDTKGSSNDFWQNLKSDILGESMIIHGPDDTTVQLPRNATVLDAVFYLYREQALRTQTVKMNGIETSFKTPVANAASIDVVFDNHPNVTREWLEWTKTGLSAAMIHDALAQQPFEQKMMIGQEALQNLMATKGKGLFDEFDAVALSALLQKRGLSPLPDLLVSMAEGRKKPQEVYEMIFEKKRSAVSSGKKMSYNIRFLFPDHQPEMMRELSVIPQKYGMLWQSVRMQMVQEGKIRISMTTEASRHEMEAFEQELLDIGATNVEWFAHRQRETVLILTIILLWALHPVVTRWLFDQGINTVTLLSLRMITFGFCTTIFFFVWRIMFMRRYVEIPHLTKLSLLPSAATVALAAFTYQALTLLPPSIHLTLLRSNVVLIRVLHTFRRRYRSTFYATIIALFSTALVVCLSPIKMEYPLAVAFSLLALAAYMSYSVVVEATLHDHKIGLRYPYLLLRTGIMLAIVGALLLPFTHVKDLTNPMLLLIGFYTLFCVFIPHACYYILLNKRQTKNAGNLFFLEPIIAAIAEIALLGIVLPYAWYPVILCTLIAIFLTKQKQSQVVPLPTDHQGA